MRDFRESLSPEWYSTFLLHCHRLNRGEYVERSAYEVPGIGHTLFTGGRFKVGSWFEPKWQYFLALS